MSDAKPNAGDGAIDRPEEFRREFTADVAVNKDKRTVELSFASELPVKRFDWRKDKEFNEVLSITPEDVDLSRLNNAHPLLMNHDPADQVGVVESARVDSDKKARAVVRFSRSQRGEEIWNDVKDGIRRLVSVGYRRTKELATEVKDGLETVRFAWQPYEISIVSVPADASVGIGRAKENLPEAKPKENKPMADTPTIDINHEREEARKVERNRITEINAIASKLNGKVQNIADLCQKAIGEGKTVDEFRAEIFPLLPGVTPVSKPTLEVPEKDQRQYSLVRAINQLSEPGGRLDGLERELSDEVALKSGLKPQGFFVPHGMLAQRADIVAGTASLGGSLISTNLMAGSFIEMLRNKALVMSLGPRILDNLVGNVTISKQTNGGTANWPSGEAVAATQGDIGTGLITLSPSCITAWANYSKLALAQTTPAIDQLVRQDLLQTIALNIDLAVLHTQTNAPTPISAVTGIATVAGGDNGAAPTFAHMVSLETELAIDNADTGSIAYLTNPKVRGALKQTLRDTAGGGMVWTDGNTVNGYRALATNQVKSNLTKGTSTTVCSAVFLGNWSELIFGFWGGTDLVVDPYTNATTRIVRVLAHNYLDWDVRHAQSFAVMLDALA